MSQNVSKPVSFPTCRRSHFRSQTYLTLVRIFSHFPATADNGGDRIEQEEPENGHEFSKFTGSNSVDPKDHVLEEITQEVHETTEGVGNKGSESATSDVVLCDLEHMLDIKEVEDSLIRHWENKSKHENDFIEQDVMECKMQNEEEKGDIEEGELAEDFEMDGECGSMLKPANQDQGTSSISKEKVDISKKKRCGPGSEERKAKTKGDKCKFSHDTVPLTKSTPCRHFARHSCMKGDDCPFDHELSKNPCNNFVAKDFCSRGDACLFSIQIPIKEASPTPSKLCRQELKPPLMSRNTSFSVPPNSRRSSVQQNHFTTSMGIRHNISSKDKVTDIPQKQLSPAPKGIRFINIAKSSLPNPSTPEQGMMTLNKEILVQSGACANQSASGTNQALVEIPNQKLRGGAPKGANFLSFGKGSVCSFGSSVSSLFTAVKVVTHENFEKNQSLAEGIKSSVPRKAWTDDAITGLQGSLYSHVDHSRGKSVQEAMASNNSQTSTAISSMLLVSQFGLR